MKKTFFIFIFGGVHFLYAQQPEFKIEPEVFDNLSFEFQNKLLPFLTVTLIETVETNDSITLEEKNLIKNWLVFHQDLKILKRSFYDSLSEERKIVYNLPSEILILQGEELRYSDILIFDAQ